MEKKHFCRVEELTSEGLSHALKLDHCMCWDPQLCCRVFSEQTGLLNSGSRPLVQVPFEGKLKKSHPPSHLFIIQTRILKKLQQVWNASRSETQIETFTWFSLHASRLCFGQFQGSDPALAFHLAAGLQMVRLRPAIWDDKVAGVIYSDGCRGQVYCATTCVPHLSLGSDNQEFVWTQICHCKHISLLQDTSKSNDFTVAMDDQNFSMFIKTPCTLFSPGKCTCSTKAAHCLGQTTSADIPWCNLSTWTPILCMCHQLEWEWGS